MSRPKPKVSASVGGILVVAIAVAVIGAGCGGGAVDAAGSKAAAEVVADSSAAKELALRVRNEASLGEPSAFGTAAKAFDDSSAAFEGAVSSGDPAELKTAERANAFTISAKVETAAAEDDPAESDTVVSTLGDAVCNFSSIQLNNQLPLTPQQWMDWIISDLQNRLGYSLSAIRIGVLASNVQAKLNQVEAELNSVRHADPTNWRWWVQQLQWYWQC